MSRLTEWQTQPYLVVESPTFDAFRSGEDGDWADGIRPPNIVETLDDVEWIMARVDKRAYLICGFCEQVGRPTSLDAAVRWFNTHACKGDKCRAA